MDPKVAQQRAQSLVDNAVKASGGDRLKLFSQLDEIFRRERWAVRAAIRKNPVFKSIVDGAADGLINGCLRGTKDGDQVMPYFYRRAMNSHPELAAAYVVSAVHIFEKKEVLFTTPDRDLRALASHIRKSDERESQTVTEAIRAINRLGQLVVRPAT